MSLSDTAATDVTQSSKPRSCEADEPCTRPRSTSGLDRGPVIAVVVFSLSMSFVALLLYCLLKPISDLVSGAGHGFGTVLTTTGSGMALFLNSTWGIISSRAGPTYSYIQCEYLHRCHSTPSDGFYDEHAEVRYNRTVSMAALLNLEAQDAIHVKLYLTNISNGLVFDVVAVQIDVFGQLNRDAGYDLKLPAELGSELSKRFQNQRNALRKFMSLLYVVNEAGYDALKTFREQLASLEKPIKYMRFFPSSSSYQSVQARTKKLCTEVDQVLFKLHAEVHKTSRLLRSINDDLTALGHYLTNASDSLPGRKSNFRPYLSALGLSGTLDHNIAKLEGFAVQVELATNDLDALGNVLKKMSRSSERLQGLLDTASPTTTEGDFDLLVVLDKFKEYQRLLV